MSFGHIDRRKLPQVRFGKQDKPPRHPKRVREDYVSPQDLVVQDNADKIRTVLKRAVKNPILVALISTAPKPVIIMFNWFKERLGEPSTYHGLNAFAGAVGMTINPDAFELIVQLLLAVAGIIEITRKGGKFMQKNADQGVPEE